MNKFWQVHTLWVKIYKSSGPHSSSWYIYCHDELTVDIIYIKCNRCWIKCPKQRSYLIQIKVDPIKKILCFVLICAYIVFIGLILKFVSLFYFLLELNFLKKVKFIFYLFFWFLWFQFLIWILRFKMKKKGAFNIL